MHSSYFNQNPVSDVTGRPRSLRTYILDGLRAALNNHVGLHDPTHVLHDFESRLSAVQGWSSEDAERVLDKQRAKRHNERMWREEAHEWLTQMRRDVHALRDACVGEPDAPRGLSTVLDAAFNGLEYGAHFAYRADPVTEPPGLDYDYITAAGYQQRCITYLEGEVKHNRVQVHVFNARHAEMVQTIEFLKANLPTPTEDEARMEQDPQKALRDLFHVPGCDASPGDSAALAMFTQSIEGMNSEILFAFGPLMAFVARDTATHDILHAAATGVWPTLGDRIRATENPELLTAFEQVDQLMREAQARRDRGEVG